MIEKINNGYIININKPEDWTSFDVVRKIRGITGFKKVGHAGTLDPFATGVLIICLGKATKNVHNLMELPKEYETTLELGKATDTLDRTGQVVEIKSVPHLDAGKIKSALPKFTGLIKQRIPAYSAAKIKGHRSYKLARKGLDIPERYKYVTIHELTFLDFTENRLKFSVICSRGTYIRTLGEDIARDLGTCGHLIELRRTAIGNYRIEKAVNMDNFKQYWSNFIEHENFSQN